MPVARLAMYLSLAVCAATAFDLLGRFGQPVMQPFAADPRERIATITSKAGLPQTVIAMDSRFGQAVAERFAVTPGVALTATYDAARAATEIVIAPTRPMLDADEEARFIPALDVEQSGCSGVKSETFDNLSITRSFYDCRLPEELIMQTTVRWRSRWMVPEAGKKEV